MPSKSAFLKYSVYLVIILSLIYKKVTQKSEAPIQPPHRYEILPTFLSDAEHQTMTHMFETLGDFPSGKQDWTSQTWVSIGEDYAPDGNGDCNKTYTMYNAQTKQCQFPNRVDVGRHFILSGGYNGLKESYESMVYRLSPFINYQFDAYKRPEFVKLFEKTEFQSAMTRICGAAHPFFRPFQLSMILNLPGNSVPQHLDIPYFFGATRYHFPQWLLLVMQDSTLFRHRRLPQVQALVYVHDWQLTGTGTGTGTGTEMENSTEAGTHRRATFNDFGGEFVLYPQGYEYSAKVVPAAPKSAIFCDGSEQIHATSIFKPEMKPLPLEKDADNRMRFDAEQQVWRLFVDHKATEHTYSWQNIRASIAYRGWCFESEQAMQDWDPYVLSDSDLTLDTILEVLKQDLIVRNRVTNDKWNQMDRYEIGLFLLDEYIKLPKPTLSRIPFNYCLIFTQLPSAPFLQWLENTFCK